MIKLEKPMPKDKTITRDGIPDNFLKNTNQINLINDLWKNNTINTNIYLCEARLVLLNQINHNLDL